MRIPALVLLVLGAAVAHAGDARADWEVTRDPFDPGTIAAYKAILARDPHDPALAKLVELYQRYRSIDVLKREYEQRGSGWADLVVIGRIYNDTGDPTKAQEVWAQALALKADDARTWMLVGRAAAKPADARAAYDKALAVGGPAIAKQVLPLLADIAMASGDNAGADRYYGKLVELDPKNPKLRIARGDALLAAGRPGAALASYTIAEELLALDPPRRIEVIARRGEALARLKRTDEAAGELRRAIGLAPRNSGMAVDLIAKLIDIFRRANRLGDAVAYCETIWPKPARRVVEWSTLGGLYDETGELEQAIAAFETVVTIAPREVAAHHRLLKVLERAGRTDDAIARYEQLARDLPRDASFQLELADRYWPARAHDAIATLVRLATRLPRDPIVLGAIADRYVKWNRRDLAIAEYEKLAAIDPEYLLMIGEQYAALDDKPKLIALRDRIAARRDPALLAKICRVILDHGLWLEALGSYTFALAKAEHDPELWGGRAAANEGLQRWDSAANDARRALAETGGGIADRKARHTLRHLLVRVALRSETSETYAMAWRLGFHEIPPDIDAGYMLAEYLAIRTCSTGSLDHTCPNEELQEVLEKLVAIVPDDPEPRAELARVLRVQGDFERAIATLRELARLTPDRRADIEARIDTLRVEHIKQGVRRMTQGFPENLWIDDDDIHVSSMPRSTDPLDQDVRIGLRAGGGKGFGGEVKRAVLIGGIATVGLGPHTSAIARVDWTQREEETTTSNDLAFSIGLGRRLATTQHTIVEVGIAARNAVRIGRDVDRFGVAADYTLDITSRDTPFGVGVRLEQGLVGIPGATALLELTVEVR
jgi:tetratricopeptide (TPR) repeat protein